MSEIWGEGERESEIVCKRARGREYEGGLVRYERVGESKIFNNRG